MYTDGREGMEDLGVLLGAVDKWVLGSVDCRLWEGRGHVLLVVKGLL